MGTPPNTSIIALLILAVATPVAAQQTTTPTLAALQINQAVSTMALALENLQRQVADDQARIKELEQKCGDRCKPDNK